MKMRRCDCRCEDKKYEDLRCGDAHRSPSSEDVRRDDVWM